MHACPVHAQPARDLAFVDPLSEQLADLGALRPCGWRASLVLAFGLGGGNAFALSFKHDLALEGSDGTEHGHHQLPGRSVVEPPEIADLDTGLFRLDPLDNRQE